LQVFTNCFFSGYYEIFRHFDSSSFLLETLDWACLFQTIIRTFHHLFAVAAVLIFGICGELLVVLYRKTAEELENLMLPCSSHLFNQKRIFGILKGLEHLCKGTLLLHKRFFSMMLLKFCLDVSMLLACSYYFIEYWKKNLAVFTCWEAVVVFQSFISLWIICHTSDRMRQSVNSFVINIHWHVNNF